MESRVPQGGVLSPVVFIIYVSDFELCLKWSTAITYADDTSTSVEGLSDAEVLKQLEEDAKKCIEIYGREWVSGKPFQNIIPASEFKKQ